MKNRIDLYEKSIQELHCKQMEVIKCEIQKERIRAIRFATLALISGILIMAAFVVH